MQNTENYQDIAASYFDLFIDFVIDYGPKLIGAIILLLLGLWIIKIIIKNVSRLMDKSKIDESLKPFFKTLISVMLKLMLFISVMGIIGVEMTSFVAIIGAVGLAIGLALSGTLQNFAGGVIILILKPYKVGDYIEAQGYSGSVKGIQIFNTIITTPDNKTIIIPNGGLSTGSLINYSTQPERRVNWTFGIAYGDNIDLAKDVLHSLMKSDNRILIEPEPFVALSELADSSVNLVVRAWVKAEDYWAVFYDMNEKAYKEFNEKGLNIPFPQMDVHMHKN